MNKFKSSFEKVYNEEVIYDVDKGKIKKIIFLNDRLYVYFMNGYIMVYTEFKSNSILSDDFWKYFLNNLRLSVEKAINIFLECNSYRI